MKRSQFDDIASLYTEKVWKEAPLNEMAPPFEALLVNLVQVIVMTLKHSLNHSINLLQEELLILQNLR
mgnify:CR=1 FL=1